MAPNRRQTSRSPSPYLGVRDGEAVHRLGRLEQLDLLDDVGLGAQDHHPLQPALGCGTQGGRKRRGESARSLRHSAVGNSLIVCGDSSWRA